ncbi:hypothetical protein P3T18_006101 [Paraburkholderia sp. GAS199]|uniref:hypothetical protein n=1 Tax=Paraburkholderia sp. GAS199 TaxID=3035126 RepID=UPI003D1A14C6
MKQPVLNTLIVFASLGLGFAPGVGHAGPLDTQLDCQSSPHDFISPLLDSQSIDAKPMRIEPDSVNAFRPTRGSNLTAFGFHVYAVFGYQQDDPMFKPGSGTPIKWTTYGVVVSGPSSTVETRVRQAGSAAGIRDVVPLILTAIYCNGH